MPSATLGNFPAAVGERFSFMAVAAILCERLATSPPLSAFASRKQAEPL